MLERLIASFLVGILLSLGGSLVQGLTQNDLASPSTLGMNALALLNYLICFFLLGVEAPLWQWSLGLNALVAGLLYFWGQRSLPQASFEQLQNVVILLGLSFNLFVGAVYSFLQFAMMTMNREFPAELWFGHFKFVSWEKVGVLALMALLLYGRVVRRSAQLQALSFGQSLARQFGVDLKRLYLQLGVLAFLGAAVVSSLFGIFGFLGLVFPLFLRSFNFFKFDFKRELQWGPPLAGLILMGLDQLCYHLLVKGAEIPVGMLGTLFGTAALVLILVRRAPRGRVPRS